MERKMYYVGVKSQGHAEIYLSSKEFTSEFHPDNVRFCFGGYRTRKQAEQVAMYQNYIIDNDWRTKITRFC
jgi:hypothetical protein